MTRKEACEVLRTKFPGKRLYVQAMYWIYEDGADRAPDFMVCVYDVQREGDNLVGSGGSLDEAVESVLTKTVDHETEADAMFAAVG